MFSKYLVNNRITEGQVLSLADKIPLKSDLDNELTIQGQVVEFMTSV